MVVVFCCHDNTRQDHGWTDHDKNPISQTDFSKQLRPHNMCLRECVRARVQALVVYACFVFGIFVWACVCATDGLQSKLSVTCLRLLCKAFLNITEHGSLYEQLHMDYTICRLCKAHMFEIVF